MNGFERRKEQKKESIRRAAIELFQQYGFDKVSINDIARHARVSHVTIYNHFGSKEELVRDVVKNAISGLIDMSREIIESDIPFPEKLEQIIFGKVQTARQYQGELMKKAVAGDLYLQAYIETLWRNEVDKLIRELINEGKERGYIDSTISDQTIMFYFEIIRNGAFSSKEMLDQLKVDGNLARELNNLFMFGLVNKKD